MQLRIIIIYLHAVSRPPLHLCAAGGGRKVVVKAQTASIEERACFLFAVSMSGGIKGQSMRIAYQLQPDREFLFRGVMRTGVISGANVCRMSRTDIMTLLCIAAAASWIDAKALFGQSDGLAALTQGAVAAAAVFAYLIGRICFLAWSAVRQTLPQPLPSQMEIEPGRYLKCTAKSANAFDWSAMTKASKFEDMYVLTFRPAAGAETSVLVERARLLPEEDAALEKALVLA